MKSNKKDSNLERIGWGHWWEKYMNHQLHWSKTQFGRSRYQLCVPETGIIHTAQNEHQVKENYKK